MRAELSPPLFVRRRTAAALVLLTALVVFNVNLRVVGTFDSRAAALLPFNFWQGQGFTMDRFAAAFPPPWNVLLMRSPSGHLVSFYPVVAPIVASPFYAVWVAARLLGRPAEPMGVVFVMEKWSASSIAAISVALVFLCLDRLTRRGYALLLTAAYAFGTSTWMISSQALWQHGPAELLLAAALAMLLSEREHRPWGLTALGIVAGLLTANRPVSVVFSAAIAWVVLRRYGRRAAPFAVAAFGVAVLWLTYNRVFFRSPLGGYGAWRDANGRPLWMASSGLEGFAGLIFSNRGLLVYSPFFLFVLAAPRSTWNRLRGVRPLIWAVPLFLYLSARTPDWGGGYCYGPRFVTDALPVLILALAAPLEGLRSRFAKVLFASTVALGIAFQAIGSFFFPGADSGNEAGGLWNLRNFSPVVALHGGVRNPDFAYLVFPHLVQKARLPDDGIQVRYRWVSPAAERWDAGEARWIRLAVANRSVAGWSSLGGRNGYGAVRILGTWQGRADGPAYSYRLDDFWLAATLSPGEEVLRRINVRAPNVTGPIRLCFELMQVGYEAFSARGIEPLCSDLSLSPRSVSKRGLDVEWNGGYGPREIASGSDASFQVGVRNAGRGAWTSSSVIAYHWVQFDGPNGDYNGVATPLPRDGRREASVAARVMASVPPGRYGLQFDLLDPRYGWASNNGSPAMMVAVRVVDPAGKQQPAR